MDTDDLIVLDDRDKDISPQTVSKLLIDGDYILKKKNAKEAERGISLEWC